MKYQLHDADPKLWAWVKARAYLAELSINDYIISILLVVKRDQEIEAVDKHKYEFLELTPLDKE